MRLRASFAPWAPGAISCLVPQPCRSPNMQDDVFELYLCRFTQRCLVSTRHGGSDPLPRTAQCAWHTPVDDLQPIENKSHRFTIVCLTLLLATVKHTCSLTVSKVFPVGGESGAQTSSLRPSTELEVISESGNGSCWRPGTAVPRREGESSCISFSARRCREGTKSGACKGGRACGAQLLRCLIAARQSSRAPDAIRRMGSQVALTSPTACQPQTGRPADGRHPAVSLRGAVRVYSELLVEANRIL